MLLPKHKLDELDFYKLDMGREKKRKDYSVYFEDKVTLIFKKKPKEKWWHRQKPAQRETISMERQVVYEVDGWTTYREKSEFAELRHQLHRWAGGSQSGGGGGGGEPKPLDDGDMKATGTDGKVIPFREND